MMYLIILFLVGLVQVAQQQEVQEFCRLPQKKGLCLGYFERYYYNVENQRCEKFIYGGCQGNENNFKTLEECEESCGVARADALPVCEQDAEPGRCLAYIVSYYYDKNTGECKKFIYGGCGGNDNRFTTKKECEDTCVGAFSEPPDCESEPETGLCRGYFPRYYFDGDGVCRKFVYGGCGGNRNNYGSEDECLRACS